MHCQRLLPLVSPLTVIDKLQALHAVTGMVRVAGTTVAHVHSPSSSDIRGLGIARQMVQDGLSDGS